MTGLQAAIVSGSALIVIIALLRAALRRHLLARLFPALWCVAAVRLLLPVSIPTRISIWNLFSTRASSPGGMVSETLTAFPALAQTTASAVSPDPAAQVPVLPLIWLSGALLLGLYFALGYAHSIKTLRAGSLAPSPVEALLLDLFGFANRPAIRASKNPRAPVTFGTVRPVIVLPEDSALDRTQLSLVLAHELAHVRRKDCLRKLLLTICLCVYFWNPLVWGMVVLANRDMELACDEKVLSVLGSGFKKQYALTLLSVAQRQQRSSCLCSAFAKRPLEARIVSILNFRRMAVWSRHACCCGVSSFRMRPCHASSAFRRKCRAGAGRSRPCVLPAGNGRNRKKPRRTCRRKSPLNPRQKNCPNSRLLMPQRKKRPPTPSRWKTQTRQSQIPTAGASIRCFRTEKPIFTAASTWKPQRAAIFLPWQTARWSKAATTRLTATW